MKRILTTLSIFIFLLNTAAAQTAHPFELGFNGGAAWLKSDVKTGKLGSGLGLTFGQTYCMNKTSPLLWGWRFRYLNANTYGQDSKKSYGIANNVVLNGDTDTLLDYYHHDTYVYQNYKTHIDEVSVEVLLGLNKIRERSNFYPYIFGGAGLVKAVARTNQLNDNNQRYDYVNMIDTNGTSSNSEVLSQLNNIKDGSYETLADGNRNPKWKFMPSLGVGFGFEIIKGFSIGLEHKMTWAFNDVLEGQQWSGTNSATGTNDMYHYTSVWLKFSFGRGAKSSGSTTNTTNTTTDVNNYTATPAAPAIAFTNPSSSPFTASSQNATVSGTITNINSGSDMGITQNGIPVNGFNYNTGTHVFSYPATLQSGANTFVVTATNATGTVNASTTVVYSQPVVTPTPEAPPAVTFTSPASSPYTTTSPGTTVSGTVSNITARSQLQVTVNGAAFSGFSYSASTHVFSMNLSLIPGANTVVVSASNAAGNDSKTATLIFKQEVVAATPAPLVTITSPSANPYNTTTSPAGITATIQNITAAGQIQVLLNSGPVPASKLHYNTSTHQLNFNVPLIQGANTIVISATNVGGSDSKTGTIIYTEPVQQTPPPVVSITNPAANPFNTTFASATVNATVANITAIGQVSVLLNGGPVPGSALNYNTASHQLMFNVNLIQGANTIVVSATNVSGSDSKTGTIIYTQPVQQSPAPVVNITNPAANPFNTSTATASVTASVTNITAAGQISVLLNGGPVPASALNYNLASHQLMFNVNLIQGANTIVVSATNVSGSDSKNETIIYTQPVAIAPPVVTITNPAANPFNTVMSAATVNASILNISSAGQITVTLNGGPVPTSALNYNLTSHQLTFNTSLIQGANTIVVAATNISGSDSKTGTIIYTQPVVIPAPVVTISNPSANPSTTTAASAPVTASVTNITSASQISVLLNGGPMPASALNYNLASHQLTFNANLVAGANTLVVSASNVSGSDSKTSTIIYSQPVVIPAPVITITAPNANPFAASSSSATVNATVLNVTAAGQVTVSLNGTATSAFTFNASTQQLSMTASLIPGSNTVTITATNASGSDSKTQTINYTVQVLPPVVSYITPASGSASSAVPTFAIAAKATNVMNSGQVSVKVNGTPVTGFTFMALTKKITFTANLVPGNNSIVITATNSAGTDSKTATINYTKATEPVNPANPDTAISLGRPGGAGTISLPGSGGTTGTETEEPLITLVNPASTPFTTTSTTYVVTMKVSHVPAASGINVKVNGADITGFSFDAGTNMLTIPLTLVMGSNTVMVTAVNNVGEKRQKLTVMKQ